MTSWACVSPKHTLLIVSPAPLIVLMCYYCLDKDRIKPYAFLGEYRRGKYTPVGADYSAQLSLREKLTAALQIAPLMMSLSIAYIAQYLTVQAIFTTVAFSNDPFAPRDHYVYYVLMNGLGEFITRSYLSIISFIKPSAVPNLVIKRTWLFVIPLLGIMAFAICVAYYRFLANVMVIMVSCLSVGALSGVVFANVVCAVPLVVEPRYCEFSLGLVSAGEFIGSLLASLAGLQVEPALRQHCENKWPKETCFTRNSRNEWSAAVCSS